jgi:uncharacterized membrane protein HdeD (DUF308 family)
MDTRDTRIPINTRSDASEPGSPRPSSASPPAEAAAFWPGGWSPNDDMSTVLARNWWAIALRGVFAILFGIIALFLPLVTITALVLLFGAYMLVDGIFVIVAAVRAARQHERWGWLVVEGIADFVAAAIAFLWPLATVIAFVILMAAWAIVSGAIMTAAAFRLNVPHGRGWMLFGGIVSMIWGVLLLLWPLIGAVVLTWWMAAYALFFGSALLVLAFRLRSRRHEAPPSAAAAQPA